MIGTGTDFILETRGLVMAYGAFRAVDDVEFRIRRGSIHSVIGPNGAGKTTLFHCLTGMRRPTAGRILFDGRDITRRAPHTRVDGGMARSFQITTLFQNLSVSENLRIAAQGRDSRRALCFWSPVVVSPEQREFIDGLLDRLGLTARADTIAGELSHGQQRVLEVGMALAAKPRLLLLDEPTSGMGINDIPMMTRLIGELGRDHTIVLIEHNMSIVMSISDRVTVMHRGSMLVEGSPAEVRQDARVRAAYLGQGEAG